MLCGRACVSKTSKQTKRNRTLGARDSWNAGNQDLRSGYKGFSFPEVKAPGWSISHKVVTLHIWSANTLTCSECFHRKYSTMYFQKWSGNISRVSEMLHFSSCSKSRRMYCFSLRRTLPGVSVYAPLWASRVPDLEAVRKEEGELAPWSPYSSSQLSYVCLCWDLEFFPSW